VILKGFIKTGQQQYLAVLYFEGLNNVHFLELKQEVHIGCIMYRIDTTSKITEQTLQMYHKFRHKGLWYIVLVNNKVGATCLQQGISEPIMGKGGKLLKCFQCGKNHRLGDCPDIDASKKRKLWMLRESIGRKERIARLLRRQRRPFHKIKQTTLYIAAS
jgi:hypothetical protein